MSCCGIPEHKDEVGSQAYAQDGIVQRALREARKQFPDLYYITDVCMCEYTSHGHCGVLCGHDVENDGTLELLGARLHCLIVQAGADMVALFRYDGRQSCRHPPFFSIKTDTSENPDHVVRGKNMHPHFTDPS